MSRLLLFRAFLYSLLEDLRAWRRGEKRVAPRGVRGRVYSKRSVLKEQATTKAAADAALALSRAVGTVELRVVRKDGTEEFYEYPVHKMER